jgi:hypothetical protein
VTTPAQTLRAAAQTLRNLATAADAINPSPWEPRRTHPTIPDSDFYRLWAADRTPLLHGGRPFVLGPIAQYTAAMHPGVGLALAEWLDSAAEDAEMVGPDHHALATARAILGEVTE